MKNQTEELSGIDNLMLYMDHPGTPLVITGFLQFRHQLNFKHVTTQVERRLLCNDKFKKHVLRPAGGDEFPKWETYLHFNLNSHLFHTPAPFPGNSKHVRELFRRLSTAPLDPSKPLWQIHYIDQVEEGGAYLFFKVHHCIADGIAMAKLLASLTDEEPFPANCISTETICDADQTPPSGLKKAGRQICRTARCATRGIQAVISDPADAKKRTSEISDSLSEILGTMTRVLLLPADSECFKGKPAGISRQTAWTVSLSLEDIKKTGAHFNATVNDVVVALTTGGLRRYLLQQGALEDMPGIRMAIPVNLRPRNMEHEPGIKMKNEFGFVLASLPIYIKDPVRRIQRVKSRLARLKRSSDADTAWIGLNLLGKAPAEVTKKTANLFTGKITGIISNVPGPGQKRYFAGGEIENIMFWLPLIKGLSIGVGVISYNNTLSLGIITDSSIVPDPETMIGHIEAEFQALLDMVPDRQV